MNDKKYYDFCMQLVNLLRVIEAIYILFMFIMAVLIFINPGIHSIFLALIVIAMLIYLMVYGKVTIMDAKTQIGNYVTKKVIDKYCERTSYFTLHDLLIKHVKEKEEKYSLIDHVIITAKGIFVIDTKFYNGTIWGKENDEKWTYFSKDTKGKQYKSSCDNPIIKNNERIDMIKKVIENDNVLYYNIASFIDWVDFKRCVIESNDVKCIYTYEIPTTVEEFIANSKMEKLTTMDLSKIYMKLKDSNLIDPDVRKAYKEMQREEKIEYV